MTVLNHNDHFNGFIQLLENILGFKVTLTLQNNAFNTIIMLKAESNNDLIAYGEIIDADCFVTHSMNAYVVRDQNNKGIGRIMNLVRMEVVRRFHYTQVITCQVNPNNKYQKKILRANKWKKVFTTPQGEFWAVNLYP